jgi:internalin A
LESLSCLELLDLRGNPLPIFPELLGSEKLHESPGTPQEVFEYLRELRSGEKLPLNEAKVLFVGESKVGKTSVLQRLKNDAYDPLQSQTHGLEVIPWEIHVNAKDIRLNLWDFGGQDIYHATHQFFLTKRSLYVLIADCRDSEEKNKLDYWLELINTFGGNAPVIIVGNKADEQRLGINSRALRDKYPNIKDIIETSCQSGAGIAELQKLISQEISKLKEVYDLLPLSWFEAKKELENMSEDFITQGRYSTICSTHGILAEPDQARLLRLLHNLGTVLNFHDHPILQSTNILNPHWVTKGIYALLDDREKDRTKGMITYADLERLLDGVKYPADRYHCLMALMKEFELCFELTDRPEPTFLIPGILPQDEPKDIKLEGDTLDFQYHYRIWLESIISRFIVLMHEKIHDSTYWRSGVILAYKENGEVLNLACIKADPSDCKISISVNGHKSTRRAFLIMIRDVFAKIHRTFKNLDYDEMVPVPGYPNADPLDYKELLGLEEMGETEKKIGKLKLSINLRQLLDGYDSIESRQNYHENNDLFGKPYEDMREIAKIAVSRPIHNEANAMSSKQDNNFEGNLSGIIASPISGGAQIKHNTFTQNNNPSANELIKLIVALRQLSAEFPAEIQEEVEINIIDVETEAAKPEEQRSTTRLKRSLLFLTGLATSAVHIAHPIAGITEFVNTVIELANKLHIALPFIK